MMKKSTTKKMKQPTKKPTKKSTKKAKKTVVVVSGGFDPVHKGHVRMFERAKKLGDTLVVILNNDNWLRKKKGYTFMTEDERKEVIESFRAVDKVVLTRHPKNPTDMSVCDSLREIRPDIFANGGDRKLDNIPEVPVCEEIGSKMIFSIGEGGKVQSSSWLVAAYLQHAPCVCGSGKKGSECHGTNNSKK